MPKIVPSLSLPILTRKFKWGFRQESFKIILVTGKFATITLNRGSTALCYCLTEDFKTVWKCHGLLYVSNKVTRYFKSQSLELLGCLTFNV